jgi:GntR family transcriptional regulator
MILENTGVPLYLQVYEILKQNITSERWQEGQLIPTENKLMETHAVGRETVRRAVLKLVNEGYLYRQRGKGTYVCRKRPEDGLEQLVSFTSEMIARGYKPGTRVLHHDIRKAGPEIAGHLNCNEHESIIYLKRLRTANDLLVAVEDSYLCKETIGELDPEKLEGSFYNYLVYDKGITPGRITQEISSSLADEDTAKLLEISPGHPILQLSRLMYTADGNPFFWMTFRYRGDVYSIKTKLDLL